MLYSSLLIFCIMASPFQLDCKKRFELEDDVKFYNNKVALVTQQIKQLEDDIVKSLETKKRLLPQLTEYTRQRFAAMRKLRAELNKGKKPVDEGFGEDLSAWISREYDLSDWDLEVSGSEGSDEFMIHLTKLGLIEEEIQ